MLALCLCVQLCFPGNWEGVSSEAAVSGCATRYIAGLGDARMENGAAIRSMWGSLPACAQGISV